MNEQDRARNARQHFHAMSRQNLTLIAMAAWRYHQQTNQLCMRCEQADAEAECICGWIDKTREQARDQLRELLPD